MEEQNSLRKQIGDLMRVNCGFTDERAIDVCEVVCVHYGLSAGALFSERRLEELVKARFVCFHLMSVMRKFSQRYIGGFWGYDTSSISTGCKQLRNWMDVDIPFASEVELLRGKLLSADLNVVIEEMKKPLR